MKDSQVMNDAEINHVLINLESIANQNKGCQLVETSVYVTTIENAISSILTLQSGAVPEHK